ncbi:MAG: hypothetical protein ABI862_12665 [Ilumatobacteraceae bacterium]
MSEDEVTCAADSKWLAELRAAATASELDDAPLRGDEVPRFAEDLATENGETLAGADIMEQVRQAVAAARPVEPATIESAPGEPASFDRPPSASAAIAQRPGDRWSPPPRLKPAPTPQLPALLLPDVAARPRRHIVAIAAVVLVAVGALIGGLLRGGGGDSPSRDTVSVTSQVGGTGP